MEKFLKNQQIPLTQVIDPSTGQAYYAPQNVVYNDKVDSGPTYLRDVIVDQAATASYFSGSITNAVSASYALTASYLAGSIESASYAITASYANYAETASSALNAQDILIYVKNQSGAPIAKGVVVHITASGNSSDIPRVITASYENDNNSANTLGITNQSIANGSEGFVMTEGVLKGINTNAFVSGQLIYLGPTGSIIGYAPTAPLHSVRLGQVVREQSNNGSIYVRIDNGYELEELHDVLITSASSGDLLIRSGSVWTNLKQLTGSYAITGSLTATSFTGSFSGSGTITSASYATQAGNSNTINVNSFSSPVESYLLMSNVVATTGVAIGGDSDLRYNSSTNILTVPNISATTITGSFSGSGTITTSSFALTASYVNPLNQTVQITGSLIISGSLVSPNGIISQLSSFPPSASIWGISNSYPASNYGITYVEGFPDEIRINGNNITNHRFGMDIGNAYISIASGQVGIGTTSTTSKLQVRGSGATSGTITLRVENTNASASFFVRDDGSVWSYGPKFISSNTTFGANAHVSLDSGSNNSAFGVNAGNAITNGTSNTSIGTNANRSLTLGNNNTAVGSPALFTNITGSSNSAIGANSLYFATSNNNTGVGVSSLYNTTTGDNNVGLGFAAVYLNTTGTAQTGVGYAALYSLNTGSNNVALGLNAGRSVAPSSSPLSSSGESIFIGVSSRANANGETNQIVIGYDANGIGSNSVVLGNNNITRTALKGSVGIGTTTPSASLHISGASSAALFEIDSPAVNNIIFVSGSGQIGFNQTSSTSQVTFKGVGGSTYTSEINTISNGAYGFRTDGPTKSTAYFFTNSTGNINSNVGTSILYFDASNNVGLNVSSSLTSKFQVRGSGTTSATTALRVENANASASLVVLDNSNVGIGGATPTTRVTIQDSGNYFIFIDRANSTPGGNNPVFASYNSSSISAATYGWGWYDSSADGNFSLWRRNFSTTGALVVDFNRTNGNVSFTNNVIVTGSVIATSFTGSLQGTATTASNITPAITNNVDNRILTATGGGTINGESNLTFNGTDLTLNGNFNGVVTNNMRPFQTNMYFDLHPEGQYNLLPFYSNDLAYTTLRGGSVSASFGPGSTQTLSTANALALFDGASTYCAFSSIAALSGSAQFTITFPQSFNYGNTIGFSFGNTTWAARDFTVEILVTGSYVTLDTQTNYSYANYSKAFNTAANAVTGARITFSNFATTFGFRIAEIFLLNYNSQLGKAVFMGRDGGAVYSPITIQSGSTATPSYSSLTDTNTGIYFPAADTLGFVEGGVEAMRINSSGQVGIGTTSQTSQLQVKGSGATSGTTALRVENTNTSASLTVLDNGSVSVNGVGFISTNTAIGTAAFGSNISSSAIENTAFGASTLSAIINGTRNTAVGYNVLPLNTTGLRNTSMGAYAMSNNSVGSDNVAIGMQAMWLNTSGSTNTAVGEYSLYSNTTANANVGLGNSALFFLNTGSANTSIGSSAGRNAADGIVPLSSSTNSVFIGYDSRANSNGETNQIVIGHTAIGIGSNSVVLGNNSITRTALKGSVGIGTTSPSASLDVSGSGRFTNGLTVTGSLIATSFTGSLQGTASYATTALSASFASTASYVNPLVQNVIITGSLTVSGSSTLTNIGPAVFTGSFIVNDGTADLINTTNYVLNDTANIPSVIWQDRDLRDGSNNRSVQWNDRELYDSAEGSSVNWNNRILNDSTSVQSIDWEQRMLLTNDGIIAADYGSSHYTLESNLYQRDVKSFALQTNTTRFGNLNSVRNGYHGDVIQIQSGSVSIDPTVTDGMLVYLDPSGVWTAVDQNSLTATYLLGIAYNTNGAGDGNILLEGHIVTTDSSSIGPYIQFPDHGLPVYIRESTTTGEMSTVLPLITGGTRVIRVLGHCYLQDQGNSSIWMMKFRPSNDWVTI